METIQEKQVFPGGNSVFVKNKFGIKKETNKMEIFSSGSACYTTISKRIWFQSTETAVFEFSITLIKTFVFQHLVNISQLPASLAWCETNLVKLESFTKIRVGDDPRN